MTVSVPLSISPMYSCRFRAPVTIGFGPLRLAFDDIPLPLAMYSDLSCALYRTLVGYHPVGMKPSDTAFVRSAMLRTLRLFASALATKSRAPSGVIVRLFGVFPFGALG